MIQSLSSGDLFDSIFFFEEEFDKYTDFNSLYFYQKDLVCDVLKFTFGNNIDLTNFRMRGDDIFSSKQDEESSKPLFRVWFVSGITLEEDFLKTNPNCIIMFPRLGSKFGDIIILEDFCKCFFINNLYVCFDKDGNLTKFEDDKEELLFNTQMRFVNNFASLFSAIYNLNDPINDMNSLFINVIDYSSSIKSTFNKISWINLDLEELLVFSSLRRWIKSTVPHLMGTSEFDDSIIIPFISSYMYKMHDQGKNKEEIYTPKRIKTIAEIDLSLIKSLESVKFRNLDLTRRCIEFSNNINSIKCSL